MPVEETEGDPGNDSRQERPEPDLRRARRLFETSRDLLCIAGLDGYFKQLNAAWTDTLGWTDTELRSRPFVEFVHPDDREATIAESAKMGEGSTTVSFVNRYATRDGGWRWLEWNATAALDEELIYATARDVTGRMSAEAAFRASEAQTRQIIETAQDAFIAMDSSGVITDWNPQATATFGWSRGEAIGRDLAETIIPEALRERHWAGLAHLLATGEGPVLGQRLELPALRQDGREFMAEFTISEVPSGGGTSFNAFLRDISDRHHARLEFERARDDALQASLLKSHFLANMSHEIRTPMNGVLGMTELLLDTPLDERQREYAEIVRASGDALLTIINDILDLSKIEAGAIDLEAIDFDLPTMIEDTGELFAAPAQAKGLELVIDIADDLPTAVRGDPGRIRQVLTNLLGNAVKFTSAGHIAVSARMVGSSDTGATVRLQVDDTGVGIDAEKVARIFEPFAQADSSTTRTYGGTGLGLAITRQLAELMGGACGVDDRAGAGSSFWFTVPLLRGPGEPSGPEVSDRDLRGAVVLVVDDNSVNRVVLEGYLEAWGMHVAAADSGAAALELARSAAAGGHPFHLAVIDMHMPGMNGLELAATLGDDPATAGTPILLLTSSATGFGGDGSPSTRISATRISARLAKPVRRERLRRCIAAVMGGAVAERPTAGGTASHIEAGAADHGLVLLAEDNLINQRVQVAMLESGGYRVDVVADGEDAVRAVGAKRYDVVFMDCQMPRMDGYQAAARIRAQESAGHRIPIIALTASAMQEDRDRCLEAGMDDYLAKPLKRADVLAAVVRWTGTAAPA